MRVTLFCFIILVEECLCGVDPLTKDMRSSELREFFATHKPRSNPRVKPLEIEIQATETLENGIKGKDAEFAHYTKRWGFVDFRQKTDQWLIDEFFRLKKGHDIEVHSYNKIIWEQMISDIVNMKTRLCQRTVSDPVLIENYIKFDSEADQNSIRIVRKEIVFFFHNKTPIVDTFVQCPIIINGKSGYFMYITLFEQAKNEVDEEHYYVLFDLFHENKSTGTTQIYVAMRTKLDAHIPLIEPLQKVLGKLSRLGASLKKSIVTYLVEPESDEERDK